MDRAKTRAEFGLLNSNQKNLSVCHQAAVTKNQWTLSNLHDIEQQQQQIMMFFEQTIIW